MTLAGSRYPHAALFCSTVCIFGAFSDERFAFSVSDASLGLDFCPTVRILRLISDEWLRFLIRAPEQVVWAFSDERSTCSTSFLTNGLCFAHIGLYVYMLQVASSMLHF